MNAPGRRLALPLVATGLVALALPLTGGAPAAASAGDGGKNFGYSAQTTATPVYVEIYEPTIPVPATPQAELQLGYTKVVADSSSSRGRSSFLWPGDAVGEGMKTIVENLGLPPEISGPIAAQGYPVQVNSGYPSGEAGEAQEPIPGVVMRTGATERATYAQTGYSTTCDTSGGDEGEGGGGAPGLPTIPGLPGLPELPIPIPGLDALLGGQQGTSSGTSSDRSAATTRSSARSAAADEPATECQIPAQLAGLVTFGGFEAFSYTERAAGDVSGVSRSAVGDISLLGGVVTMSGVTSKVTSTSDGTKPKGKGRASYGTLTIAGQTFAIGPDGVEGGGQGSPIPGLPDEPKAALAQLGITLTVPEPTFEVDGKEIKSVVEGLVVELDTRTLTDALRTLPLQDILDQLPEETAELKKVLQAGINLSPRVVMHLGRATSKLETVDPLKIPEVVPDNDPDGEETSEETETTGGGSGGGSGAAGGGSASTDTTAGGGGSAPTSTEALPPAELASGLPELFSIPGLLLVGAIAGACVAGSYVRRIGALALGGGGACSHGLDSGLPDLRKVNP